MKKAIFISILALITVISVKAQETVFEEARTIYKTDEAYGLIIHTTGWGINYRYGQYTSGFSKRTFEGEIVGIKHPKEIKSFNNPFDNSNGYVFGKLNSITLFRASVGTHRTFVSKQSVRGIAISYVLNGGLSFAYAKPIYLEVFDEFSPSFSSIEKYDPDIHSRSDINGKGPALRGLFEGRFYPGLSFKGGLNFESSRQASRINALEIGLTFDAYFQELPIMANELNSRFLYNLYVTLAFGSKKTQ